MCGVAGFFTGCLGYDNCPMSDKTACKLKISTEHVFDNWHKRSSVRSIPRRLLDPNDVSLDLFPRNLVPIAHHPIIIDNYYEKISGLFEPTAV